MKFRYISIFILITFVSCTKADFGDLNTNPSPVVQSVPNTEELLRSAFWGTSGSVNSTTSGGRNVTILGDYEPAAYIQYSSETLYPGITQFSISSSRNNWSDFYTYPLVYLQNVINYNQNPTYSATMAKYGSNKNQIAIARIWKAFTFSILTDKFGDIPYSEALNPKNLTPKFDLQSEIYTDLFKELREAASQFEASGAVVKGDIIYNGDIAKWKKFANSLRMVLAMRLTKVNLIQAKTEFLDAFNNADGYISNNVDNCKIDYLANLTYRNPWNVIIFNGNPVGHSKSFIDRLVSLSDPRLPVYADKNQGNVYKGIPAGMKASNYDAWARTNTDGYSRFSLNVAGQTTPGYFVTAWQVNFLLAEAVLRSWITTGTSASYYTTGISLNLQANNVPVADINTYVSSTNVVLAPTDFNGSLNKIITQKYIAAFPHAFDSWAEYRRTGYPVLPAAVDPVSPDKNIPRRLVYLLSEQTLNPVNFDAAVSRLTNGNTQDSRIWWDK